MKIIERYFILILISTIFGFYIIKLHINNFLKSTVSTDKIEFYKWEAWDRLSYRSKKNNIALTFGKIKNNRWVSYYYQNFFTYDVDKTYDYFCIPDDLIICYNDSNNFITRAGALNWNLNYNLSHDGRSASINYTYKENDGFHPYVHLYEKEFKVNLKYNIPPIAAKVSHILYYDKSFVPMNISITNLLNKPLQCLYVFQDAAFMTQGDTNQKDIQQVWPDNQNEYPRVMDLKNNPTYRWFGLYNNLNGGMFSGIYAPKTSKGIRYFATWNFPENYYISGKGLNSEEFSFAGGVTSEIPENAPKLKLENIFSRININTLLPFNQQNFKSHATVIDFGILQPNQENNQTIYKIMFTNFNNYQDMLQKITDSIIQIES